MRGADRTLEQTKARIARRRVLAGLATLPALSSPVRAQQRAFPERPVRLIVPFGPGTLTDTFARVVTANIASSLGQTIVIENRPGANAIVGVEAASRATPDGYTILLGTDQAMAVNPVLFRSLPYDAPRDFAPVLGLASVEYVLVVAPTLPVRSVADLVTLAKAQPGRLTFASTGAGTPARLTAELFQRDAGIELLHVPYQGGIGPLFADLLNGTVSMLFYPYQPLKPQVEAGRMRALATASAERPSWLSELPTLQELGFRRTLMAASIAVYAPAGTPPDRIARLGDAFRRVMDTPEVRATLGQSGTSVRLLPPAELAVFNAAERERYREVLALAGVGQE